MRTPTNIPHVVYRGDGMGTGTATINGVPVPGLADIEVLGHGQDIARVRLTLIATVDFLSPIEPPREDVAGPDPGPDASGAQRPAVGLCGATTLSRPPLYCVAGVGHGNGHDFRPEREADVLSDLDALGIGFGDVPPVRPWPQPSQYARERAAREAQPDPLGPDAMALGMAIVRGARD